MPHTLRPIEYFVELPAPQTQNVTIRMVVHNVVSAHLDLALPVWRTGRYAILNPAGTVHRVRAQKTSGATLAISKLNKTTWRVETEGSSEIEIRYSLYANSLADRTRHVDDSHAFLSGAAVFLYVPDHRDYPISIGIDAPPHWRLACGLDADADDPRSLVAPNYDVLIDSPIEIGDHESFSFDVEGIPHEVVIWGAPAVDVGKLTRDFTAIIQKEAELFGGLPYNRYVFIIHTGPGLGGGTEHLNSTVIQVPPAAFEEDTAYERLIGTVSHEMFHVWNVKRLRPAALARTDLTQENYTDLLWFCEGATAYYDELVLARCGLLQGDAYLQKLGELIHQVRRRPGSRVQSLSESSFDAWIKFNQPTSDDMNTTVSFYDSGAVATFLLDMEIRSRTLNRVSMDSVMREMVRLFPDSGSGYHTEDLVEVISTLAGTRFEDFFRRYINGIDPFPLEERSGIVGLQLALDSQELKAYSGLILQDHNSQTTIRYALSDGPAHMAGVLPGDEVVALNGRRYNAAQFAAHVELFMNPGDSAQLEVLRRGRQRSIEFALGSLPKGRWRLSRIPGATAAQREAYSDWLHQSWP